MDLSGRTALVQGSGERFHAGEPETWLRTEDLGNAAIFIAGQGDRAPTTEIDVTPPVLDCGQAAFLHVKP